MQTGTQRGLVDVENLKPADVNISDICDTLSHICRFGGRVNSFYSVAQHSLVVAEIVRAIDPSPRLILGALTHDFAEAFLGDVIQPLKVKLPLYQEWERRVEQQLSELLKMGEFKSPIVQFADRVACFREAIHLGLDATAWGCPVDVMRHEMPCPATYTMCRPIPIMDAALELTMQVNRWQRKARAE